MAKHLTLVIYHVCRSFEATRRAILLLACTALASLTRASDTAITHHFNIAQGDAAQTLWQFMEHSGEQVVYLVPNVSDIRTNAVIGDYNSKDAIELLIAGTGLTIVEDKISGALMIQCSPSGVNTTKKTDKILTSQTPMTSNMKPTLPVILSWLMFTSVSNSQVPTTALTNTSAEDTVILSAFDVKADKDDSYGALNSNSITRFNTELEKMPISADIFDSTFMKDVAADSVEAMIETYSAGAGYSGADPGAAAATEQPGDRIGNAFITLRGFQTPAILRDSFMPSGGTGTGITSNFDLERVEIIQGPQALLYGYGGAGGVINTVSKQARIGERNFGELSFRTDKYGSKDASIDLGYGNKNIALRLSFLNDSISSRRINIGGSLQGYYGQLAFKMFNTIVRITGEQTDFFRVFPNSPTFTALSTANDARNGQKLTYILATNQVYAAANGGASGAGPILNGNLNWDNVNSYTGQFSMEFTNNTFGDLTADTKWNSWLSTQLAIGYNDYADYWSNQSTKIYAANSTAGIPGVWSAAFSPNERPEPMHTKGIRFTALMDNHFFHNAVHSQTVLGADNITNWSSQTASTYYQADANFNPIYNSAVTSNNGRVAIPTIAYSINNGPNLYTLPFTPRAQGITYNGINYTLMPKNPNNAAMISASNPLGVTLGGQANSAARTVNKGVFGVNYSQWLDGKIDTLVGARLAQNYSYQESAGNAAPYPPATYTEQRSNNFSFNIGLDYNLTPLLHPYISASDSYNPPGGASTDPIGNPTLVAHGLGEEVGLKFNNASNTLSGALLYYHTVSTNESMSISGSLTTSVNPSGLNGQYNTPGGTINIQRESGGVQLQLTASPTKNWRIRISASELAGKIGNTVSWSQLYNDQFYQDTKGNVTYADGNVVYVSPTYNSKQLTVAPTANGAIPLTLALMNTSTSPYYSNPANVSGQIGIATAVWNILKNGTDPLVPGSGMLTGKVGLPISSAQINTGVNPTVAGYIAPPGVITATQSGDITTGYPKYAFNFTNSFLIDHGPLKGLQIGGSMRVFGRYSQYYYYVNGISPTSPRIPFYMPNLAQVDLLLGYSKKFKRVTFRTQLNMTNLLNHYSIIILPGEYTGYTPTGSDATFNTQPRALVSTNTISF